MTNYSILLILLVTKILLPVSLRVKVKGFSVACQGLSTICPPRSSITLPLACSDPGTLTSLLFLRKCQDHSFLTDFALSVSSTLSPGICLAQPFLPFRSLLKCHLMAKPSLTSLLNITAILALHPSSRIIPVVL